MSEKGLLSKSIANNISEAIIDKLGGTGYAPTEWNKNINLLGIASADIEEALASITEDASSSDKGLLSLSIASDVGAMLNKKYNTSRGFKPSEVSSAVSMLSPLPEKTASGAIADFSDGADDVPTKSLVVTISPTLSGVSSVSVVNEGNLCDFDNCNVEANTNTTVPLGADLTLKKGTYTLAFNISDTVTATRNRPCYVINGNYTYADSDYKTSGRYSWTFTLADDTTLSIRWWAHTLSANITISDFMLTYGSTAHDFEPYQTPTQYTASLGRTIYGGTADIVNGTGTDEYEILTLAVADMNNSENYPGWRNCGVREIIGAEVSSSVTDGVSTVGQYWSYNTLGSNDILYLPRGQYNNMTQTDWKTNYPDLVIQFAIKKATPTDFTFTGQEIPTKLGYNAFWSEQGDTEVTYRADIDLYEAPSTLLGANNTETEGNEEQEENE